MINRVKLPTPIHYSIERIFGSVAFIDSCR